MALWSNTDTSTRRIITYLVVGIGLLACNLLLRDIEWKSSIGLHTTMESMATMLSLIVGIMALIRYYSKKETLFLIIGAGFLGTGFLDGYHTLVTSSIVKPYIPSDLPTLIPWSWAASRVFLSLAMVVSWLAWKKETKTGQDWSISDKTVYILTFIFTIFSFIFFALAPLPQAYYQQFSIHRPAELLAALFFLIALIGYLKKGEWQDNLFEHWIILSLIVNFVSQTAYMPFSSELFDMEFDLAHMLKKVSYICILIGLFTSTYLTFKRELAIIQALERSNAELQHFAYAASHDLQEPLRKIQAFSERLEEHCDGLLDEKGNDYLERIVNSATRMRGLIEDLLSFSRVTSKARPFTKVDLAALMNEVLADFETDIKRTEAIIQIAPLPTLHCDKGQIKQLLRNLLSNALKFSKKGITPSIVVNTRTSPSSFELTLSDNGIGFESKFSERIFGVFECLHGRGQYPGNGIGLAVCKKIVERHGGTITARGQLAQGAIFTVTLPTKPVEGIT